MADNRKSLKSLSILILILIFSFPILSQYKDYREYGSYNSHNNKKNISASSSSVNYLENASLFIDMSDEVSEYNSSSNVNLSDETGNFTGDLTPNISPASMFTADDYFIGSGSGVFWSATAIESASIEFGADPFTVAIWVKSISGDLFPSGGAKDPIGKRASDNSGPGWKIEFQSDFDIRLRLENTSSSASGIDVRMAGEPAADDVWLVWFTRNADHSWHLEVYGAGDERETTTSPMNWTLKDDGIFNLFVADNAPYLNKIGDVVIWPETKTEEFMTNYYNFYLSEHSN